MGRPIHIYRIHPFRYYDNNKWYEVPNRGEWRCTTKCRNMHLGGALVEGGGARFFKSSDLKAEICRVFRLRFWEGWSGDEMRWRWRGCNIRR